MEDAFGALRAAVLGLTTRFAAPGPPVAGSAAAATGALAAGLLEWTARLSAKRGPEGFRERASAIACRAAALQASLATAAQSDATLVRRWIAKPDPEGRAAATESVLAVGVGCAEVATLAAEVVKEGHAPIAADGSAAMQLASSAAECALQLAEANLHATLEDDRAQTLRRRIGRTREQLQRASPTRGDDSTA